MNFQKLISTNRVLLLVIFLIALRFVFINFNRAEWGDSYRLLREAETLKTEFYSVDEKRPPLFSILLSLRPEQIKPLQYARVNMAFIYAANIILFYFLIKQFIKEEKYKIMALILFGLNPIIFYWSLRVYADTFFLSFVLLTYLLYSKWYKDLNLVKITFLVAFSAFSIFVRFEGYVLVISLLAAIALKDFNTIGFKSIFRNLKNTIYSVLVLAFVTLPYMIYRNPFRSAYLGETEGHSYDLTMVATFFISFVFMLGLPFATAYFVTSIKYFKQIYIQNLFAAFYVALSLILIFVWPAAIPRLFISVIPFFSLWLIQCVIHFEKTSKNNKYFIYVSGILLTLYVVSQYFLKLQFNVVNKPVFVVIVFLSFVSLVFYYIKKTGVFFYIQLIILLLWTGVTVWMHRDIYRSIYEAVTYVTSNYSGNVGYNNINGVANYYLNYDPYRKNISGTYMAMGTKKDLSHKLLKRYDLDYLIITNEHDKTWSIDVSEMPYLEEMREFRYNVGGADFYTKVYMIKDK